jgi:hypothetical protein
LNNKYCDAETKTYCGGRGVGDGKIYLDYQKTISEFAYLCVNIMNTFCQIDFLTI